MAVNRERAKTRDPIELDIEYVTLGQALARIQELINVYGEETRIENTEEQYDDHPRLYVYAERDETDTEMNTRIAQEVRQEAWRSEARRRDYEILRKEFEGK